LTDITVEYSRPGVKDRTIFAADGLVPHGEVWRLGANKATKITFSDDVTVNGQALEKGAYAVLATPAAAEWTFHFHKFEAAYFSDYVELTPALSVSGKTQSIPWPMETFTIMFGDISTEAAKLEFMWEKTLVSLDLGVAVDETVMSNIDKVMAGPSPNDYYQAATYYHKSGKDLKQALTWIQMATNVKDKKFWQVRREALILADLGKKKEAIAAAQLSKTLAETAGNMDYVRMNKASIMEWSK